MGAFNRKAAELARNKKEKRALIGILCSVTLPLILAFLLVGADIRNNLELKPLKPAIDGATLLLGWQDLNAGAERRPQIRMLGYMMDDDEPFREGAMVRTFLLLPDAGHILHPAHRDPDQMVEVTLTTPSAFRYRHLVWVSGTLERIGNLSCSRDAMYEIENAVVNPAADTEIGRWFQP